jgi:hypothetical protein
MRLRVFSILVLIWMFALAGLASAQKHCSKVNIDSSTGFCTASDPSLTQGLLDVSQACVSSQDRPRKVTMAEKAAILAAYNYPANTNTSTGEFDPWFPYWMGGSDQQVNIWFEPHAGAFRSWAIDAVELLLWREVRRDKTITLAQAKRI